jgi:hypothetical protein
MASLQRSPTISLLRTTCIENGAAAHLPACGGAPTLRARIAAATLLNWLL